MGNTGTIDKLIMPGSLSEAMIAGETGESAALTREAHDAVTLCTTQRCAALRPPLEKPIGAGALS